MNHFLTARQPLFILTSLLGLSVFSLFSTSDSHIDRAVAQITPAVGGQISTLSELAQLPDGPHQLCSEPEPAVALGAGICFWFTKKGPQLIGYYGLPQSDIFIDCVTGTVQDEKIIGEAIAVPWEGAPFLSQGQVSPMTLETLTLERGNLEYASSDRFGEVSVIKFNRAELTLRDFYRYSPAKVKQMNTPPTSCSVQEWIEQTVAGKIPPQSSISANNLG